MKRRADHVNCFLLPLIAPPRDLGDFYFIESEEPEAIQDLVVRLVKERIPARFGFDPRKDIQVLSPMNLLYTAITRAKKLVVLVGTKEALAMAVRRQDTPTEVHRLEETAGRRR